MPLLYSSIELICSTRGAVAVSLMEPLGLCTMYQVCMEMNALGTYHA
jgi:hypothetical protein